MLCVFLSHFTAAYFWPNGPFDLANYLATASMIASPTFVIVSGMVVGFLAVTDPHRFSALRIKLADRGVFLLVIGHFLLVLTEGPTFANFGHAYSTSFITDAIAVAIIIGPWLLGAFGSRNRLQFAIALFLVDWWAIVAWHPLGTTLATLKIYLVGAFSTAGSSRAQAFPIVPWLAVYLAATVLGEQVGRMYAAGKQEKAQHLLARVGVISFVTGSATYSALSIVLHAGWASGHVGSPLLSALSIYQKFPPGIIYLAFFGGAGIVMLAMILELDRRATVPWAMNQLRHVGRASLFSFIVEYALYRGLLARFDLPYSRLWPGLFALSVVLLVWFAREWDRRGANRFLTVGLKSLVRAKNENQASAAKFQHDQSLGFAAHPPI